MNYYIPNINQRLYLYDKAMRRVTRVFPDIKEFKRWLIRNLSYFSSRMEFYGGALDLTMDMSDPQPTYKMEFTFENGFCHYVPTDEVNGYKKHLVVLTNIKAADDYSIFNYVPLIDELKSLLKAGASSWGDIEFDTRSKWFGEKKRNLPEFRRGPVPHVHKVNSSTGPHLIVSKAERWALYHAEIDPAYYDADTDSFVEYEIPRIKTRAARKLLSSDPWEGSYTEHLGKYRRHPSWKDHKKKSQWM